MNLRDIKLPQKLNNINRNEIKGKHLKQQPVRMLLYLYVFLFYLFRITPDVNLVFVVKRFMGYKIRTKSQLICIAIS